MKITKIPKLSALIKSTKFDWTNSDIKDSLFETPKEISSNYKLFNFEKYISSEDAVKEMKQQGYRPAHAWELINYAKKGWNGTDWVVGLGSVGEVGGDRSVPCLNGIDSGRSLSLDWWDSGWDAYYRFLAVKVDSKVSTVIESKDEKCKHTINFCPTCGEKI